MPFIPHTPESYILRSDSKNPSLTCYGITSNGRPCRRALAKPNGLVSGTDNTGASNIPRYCWQHIDQAVSSDKCGGSHPGLEHSTIKERTSVDTLVDRLGLLQVGTERSRAKQKQQHKQSTGHGQSASSHRDNRHQGQRQRCEKQNTSSGQIYCCIVVPDTGRTVPPRPVTRVQGGSTSIAVPKRPSVHQVDGRPRLPTEHGSLQKGEKLQRPGLSRNYSSQTTELLSLISKATDPKIAAMLLTELSKPISQQDEPGYIYMFWLTPESLSIEPPPEVISSLLESPARPRPGQRRTSEVMKTFSASAEKSMHSDPKKTILLKIGRAQNVQRRLNQWTRQCGYNISLIRYYPYNPSSPASSTTGQSAMSPRKVPCVHKVERLIHIELLKKKVQDGQKCATCGKEHREWFSVDASKSAVKEIDGIIRKWVEWGERQI